MVYYRFLRQITIPRELRGLRSKGIVDIVAGGWSFHALDRRGQVWMWGWVCFFKWDTNVGQQRNITLTNKTMLLFRCNPDTHLSFLHNKI